MHLHRAAVLFCRLHQCIATHLVRKGHQGSAIVHVGWGHKLGLQAPAHVTTLRVHGEVRGKVQRHARRACNNVQHPSEDVGWGGGGVGAKWWREGRGGRAGGNSKNFQKNEPTQSMRCVCVGGRRGRGEKGKGGGRGEEGGRKGAGRGKRAGKGEGRLVPILTVPPCAHSVM